MIAEIPLPLLTLLRSSSCAEPVSAARTTSISSSDAGETMKALVIAGRSSGLSNDFIADRIHRRVTAYMERVGNRGEGDRDNTAWRLARWMLNDFGLTEEMTLAYLIDWNRGNQPPLAQRILELKIISARRSGRRAFGCAQRNRGSAA